MLGKVAVSTMAAEKLNRGDVGDQSARSHERDLEIRIAEMSHRMSPEHLISAREATGIPMGICTECEDPISEVRLRAIPFALRCLSCEEAKEQRKKN